MKKNAEETRHGGATYKFKPTGEVYEMGFDHPESESPLAFAWGKGMKVACAVRGWHFSDVIVVCAS